MDNIHSEGVHRVPPDVVPVDPGDEDLALVIVTEETTNHDDDGVTNCYRI